MIDDLVPAAQEPLWLVPHGVPSRRRRIVAWTLGHGGAHLEPMVVEHGIVKVPSVEELGNSEIVGRGEYLCHCGDPGSPGDDSDIGWCDRCPGERSPA